MVDGYSKDDIAPSHQSLQYESSFGRKVNSLLISYGFDKPRRRRKELTRTEQKKDGSTTNDSARKSPRQY